jgi:VanZ family protein
MIDAGRTQRPRIGALVAWTLNFGYAAAITALALTPVPPRIGVRDWFMHGLAFGIQTVLLYGLFRRSWPAASSLRAAGMCALGYGGVIELLQLYVPGRYFELSDLAANGVGVLLSAALLAMIPARWDRDAVREPR